MRLERLSDLLECENTFKRILEVNKTIPTNAASYRMISEYFTKHPSSDIALVNPGGIESAYLVSEYFKNNLMIFHPAPITKLVKWKPSVEGKIQPSHPLLIIDSKIKSGKAIEQAREHFQSQGYLSEHMHLYTHVGMPHEAAWPTLKRIDEVLKECLKHAFGQENDYGLGPSAAYI